MDLDRYADLAVRVGINVQPGQDVMVYGQPEHAPIMRAIAAAAYRAGARRVVPRYVDTWFKKAAIEHGPMEALTTAYAWEIAVWEEWARIGGCFIAVDGEPDPGLMDGLDPERVTAYPIEAAKAHHAAIERIQWTIVGTATAGWATQVFGEPDVDRLWDAISFVNRLDVPDPVAAWREHIGVLQARKRALERLAPAAIRFRGPGTDLTLPMLRGTQWLAGTFPREDGVAFVPNMPTEEVYGTPHRGRGDGVVRATKPLPLPGGVLVEGLVLTIREGRIVDVQADTNAEMVRRELERDEGASYLGEVAIVDGSSRVGQSGLVFQNTLYDENAGCHIAFGMAYRSTLAGADSMSEEELVAAGVNVSTVHTDVVIGGPEVDVDALDEEGVVTPLLRDNTWQLPL
ncbi:MAG TPA: aminopeptidase [Candidatus Limnocylindrales bacterium]|nr:aminopeptidase [Candidatus Limnocylindrales bacterium]